jgi:hypothetical protein
LSLLLGAGWKPDSMIDGHTLLCWATGKAIYMVGGLECMGQLIALGANVNACCADGETPLHIAAYTGCGHAVELLLAAGPDCAAQCAEGRTPLEQALILYNRFLRASFIHPEVHAWLPRLSCLPARPPMRSCGAGRTQPSLSALPARPCFGACGRCAAPACTARCCAASPPCAA